MGFLRFLATQFPDFSPDVLTGVSAGAINAAFLAAHPGSFRERVDALANLWADLRIEDVFRVDLLCLARNVGRWGLRLFSGGSRRAPRARSLVDTQPLRTLLARVLEAENGVLTGGSISFPRSDPMRVRERRDLNRRPQVWRVS